MSKILVVSLSIFACSMLTGCGEKGNSLATDSGEMTVEEYDKMLAEQEGMVAPPTEGADER